MGKIFGAFVLGEEEEEDGFNILVQTLSSGTLLFKALIIRIELKKYLTKPC